MRKRWLIVGVAVILLLGIGIGTIAKAKVLKVQVPARNIELSSFFEKNVSVDSFKTITMTEYTWYEMLFNKDVTGSERVYLIEFTPPSRMKAGCYSIGDDIYAYEVILYLDWVDLPKRTIDDKTITPVIEIEVVATFESPEEMLEFQKSILSAYTENKKVSMEVYLPYSLSKWGEWGKTKSNERVCFTISFQNLEEE